MTRTLPRLLLAAFALTALPSGAWAQAPAQPPDRGGRPLMLAPLPRVEAPAPTPAGTPAEPLSSGGVQVQPLQAIDADSVGTLSLAEGGFGEAMWRGTPRALLERLLPYLPVAVDSAAMQSLARRLLLSAAVPPPVEGGKKGSLLATRADLLLRMGAFEAVDALLAVTPNRTEDPALARIEANARFLANDNARACALVATRIRDTDTDYWQKALIFCQILAGQHAQASLGVSLLREAKVDDPPFFALVDALIAGAGKGGRVEKPARVLDKMPAPTPLILAMARAAGVQLPADVVALNQPGVLRVVATSPNGPVEVRLDAAERAEAAGGLPAETLRQLYMAVDFPDEALANPLSRAEAGSGPLSRALLYRAAQLQTVPIAQAEAIGRAFQLARKGDRQASAARAFMPILKRIPPSAELIWFAPEAVRAFLLGGEVEMAKSWFGVLRASALFNPESAAAVTALRPILRLAGSAEAADWKPEELSAWWTDARKTENGRSKAGLLLSLFDAFGEPLPDDLSAELLDEPDRLMAPVPEPPLWFRLRGAAAAGRIGETVLLSLVTLGDEGPAAVDPMALRDVLSRLRAVNLEADARALAVEAALAAGL
ncbi:hypothetical protein [Shumkonia mesophila]|uniref:hypothetical protein n=1 Tax=Shumkonia mesophila TaxID=2838854 RepID=UPI0029347152|nr:hypothetical protein [Shumkonia mesophila]